MKTYLSTVPGFLGECAPTWLDSPTGARMTGAMTGFFKMTKKNIFGFKIKTGKEFSGYISSKGDVRSMEGIYSSSQFK